MGRTTLLSPVSWIWRTALVCAALIFAQGANANPVLLVEADTGRVLEAQDAGAPWYPASVTKLMTAYVALAAVKAGRLTFDTPLTVSSRAASQAPSKMGFKPGTQVTLDNALKMLLVKSANDMAVVIAEGVGGSLEEFVGEMNATAAYLGMTGTHYDNPNGLPDRDQITTARDLAILARAIIYHFPEQEMLFRIPAIRIGKRVLRNYNKLIDHYAGADGMKTGFICDAGFNLVATATRGHKRLIAVILGSSSAKARTEEAALLLEKGFQQQPAFNIFGAAAPTLSSLPNTGGEPTNMRAEVCGAKRKTARAENEDEGQGEGSNPFAFAASLPQSGAALLQNLPPSMPPVTVSVVSTRGSGGKDDGDSDTADAPRPSPKPRDLASASAGSDSKAKKTSSKKSSSSTKSASSKSGSSKSKDKVPQGGAPMPPSKPRS